MVHGLEQDPSHAPWTFKTFWCKGPHSLCHQVKKLVIWMKNSISPLKGESDKIREQKRGSCNIAIKSVYHTWGTHSNAFYLAVCQVTNKRKYLSGYTISTRQCSNRGQKSKLPFADLNSICSIIVIHENFDNFSTDWWQSSEDQHCKILICNLASFSFNSLCTLQWPKWPFHP